MNKSLLLGAVMALGMAATTSGASTLEEVKARGKLSCGTSTGVAGFSLPDANNVYQGFDGAVCRAVAAAVLGDPMAVEFVPTTGKTRFTALASGEIDMLARNTTWTFSRDVDLKFEFTGVNYYDGQGFMAPKDLGVSSAKDLDGATVCIQTGTTTELNLADFSVQTTFLTSQFQLKQTQRLCSSILLELVMFTQLTHQDLLHHVQHLKIQAHT